MKPEPTGPPGSCPDLRRLPGPAARARVWRPNEGGVTLRQVRPHRIEQLVRGHNGHIDTQKGMGAQISQFSKCIQRKMIKSFSEQNGGSRVKGSRTLLTKRDLPRRGGRNNRIPGISTGQLIRPGAVPDG
jgi:hypothetical protein